MGNEIINNKSHLTGYVTISVTGNLPERFFQTCANEGITVWNVKKKSAKICEGTIKLSDIQQLRKINRRKNYKIKFTEKKGYPFFLRRITKKKELMFALVCSLLLVVFLSNIIWKINITGVPKDIEEKISRKLNDYGIHSGTWIFTLDSPNKIQRELVEDIPELLWVGVHQKGTTFFLEGVEKTIVKEEEPLGPRNLIASKKGIIKKLYVSNGMPKVKVNDYVKPGDLLVSGVINENEQDEKEENKEEQSKKKYVAAEGDITATTWYEVIVNVPLTASHESLTGEQEKRYYAKLGNFQLPIWGFSDPDYQSVHRERKETPLYFLKWKMPVKIVEMVLSEKTHNKNKRTEDEAVQVGIMQAKKELKIKLGPEAKILSEKVLHESKENGKVKLNLYFNVEEDIATAQPLDQGD
ncbi:sporulation protein YqfD [Virgibacillus halodenitrificans]|uniref:Sporulation protein YqfD n=1 Tax=Virgibacillus halodenitrificans TaxID=1482 RepID=A0ABR7VLN9_VIRHA|nr:sporulation protein YqfD [Virgibacillus halodenitrificans]MBD1222835.1 sporulation protein YqfD [Virgibacillus halodenitrificans]